MNFADEDDEEEMDEKEQIESYMQQHDLAGALNSALNTVIKAKPTDPFMSMKTLLKQSSKSQRGILGVTARKIFTCSAVPTLEVDITTTWGTSTASCCIEFGDKDEETEEEIPEGGDAADEGEIEEEETEEPPTPAEEIEDLIDAINEVVAPALKGRDPLNQKELDDILVQLTKAQPVDDFEEEEVPGIPIKAIMPISMAICRAGAKQAQCPLYQYLSKLAPPPAAANDEDDLADLVVEPETEGDQDPNSAPQVPVPMFSMIGGGSFSSAQNYMQEILIMPDGAADFNEAMQIGLSVYGTLQDLCKQSEWRSSGAANPGCMGSLRPQLNPDECMELLVQAIETCGYTDKVKIAVDCAAEQLVYEPPALEEGEEAPVAEDDAGGGGSSRPSQYHLDKYNRNAEALWGEPLGGEGMREVHTTWIEKYPQVVSMEDAFVRSDGSATQAEFAAQFAPKVESEEDRLAREEEEAAAAKSKKKGKKKKDEPEEEEEEATRDSVGGDDPVKLQLVGDETVNSESELLDAIRHKELNAVVLDIAKHPTVTSAIEFCRMSQRYGVSVVAAGYGKDGKSTGDTFAADFAVGLRAGQFKAGAPCRSQFIAHYNQLMRITAGDRSAEGEQTPGPDYAGLAFRNSDMKTMDLLEMEAPGVECGEEGVEEEEA